MKTTGGLKKEYAETLKQLASNITPKDKRDFAKEFGIHYNTVSNYLKGKVVDLEIGANMIGFFGGRIKQRIKLVQKYIAAA